MGMASVMMTLGASAAFAADQAAAKTPAVQTASTDLAQITVTPIQRSAAPAAWQTIYDYSGGEALPPGTRIVAEGKWLDPIVRQDKSGVTWSFPEIPAQPQSAQELKIGFVYERPIAQYPTRISFTYTSYLDQSVHSGQWSPFTLRMNDNGQRPLLGEVRLDPNNIQRGRLKNDPELGKIAFNKVGTNTIVFTFDGRRNNSITSNGKDASEMFFETKGPSEKLKFGALLLPGVMLSNEVTQFPANKGDWFAVNSFKIEQQRPPLDASATAAVDLTVPGKDPARISIEVVDARNEAKGYVLRDCVVSPGKYRLYWDGVEQNADGFSLRDTSYVGAGAYTFRLTTSKVEQKLAGMVNNSTPPFNKRDYGVWAITALAMTPPNTPANANGMKAWHPTNNPHDTRKFDATDSVQALGMNYDAYHGQWIASDGTLINNRAGTNAKICAGRSLAMTPPDPADPADTTKQFYFASQNGLGANTVASCTFPMEQSRANLDDLKASKVLSSPDWNRTAPGFIPYDIEIGQVPEMLGQQHFLFFQSETGKGRGEWVFRNIRLYEQGSPDPGPMTFNPTKFSPRGSKGGKGSADSLMVEDNGHSVHLKNAATFNYPLDYNITPKTILSFDLDVIEATKVGPANGIGLSADAPPAKSDKLQFFNFLSGHAANAPNNGFNDASLGAYSYPRYQPNTLYTDSIPRPPAGLPKTAETRFLWQPGYYGLKITEDGKYLFACNNADGRLEVRDISTDGQAVAKIAIDYPMFVTIAPEGAAGAGKGTRYVYVDSPKAGLLRIPWTLVGNVFGKPETLTPPEQFALPRGLVYNAAAGRIIVCDTFNLGRSKAANQLVVIDPASGKVLNRFGKAGGVDPNKGGAIDDATFTCPLTVDADSKGSIWVNDYYSCSMRKYGFDPATNSFTLQRRVLAPQESDHVYWLPGGPPTQMWFISQFFIRSEADLDAAGQFTNQRVTSAFNSVTSAQRAPFAHFSRVGEHVYLTMAHTNQVWQQAGDGWVNSFSFGGDPSGKRAKTAGEVALHAGLLARPGEPPTALDQAIKASGDASWQMRPWAWSDLNGDRKMEYTKENPEFKIYFNAPFSFDTFSGKCFRASDGALVAALNNRKAGQEPFAILVMPPVKVNGATSYDWSAAKTFPCTPGDKLSDILAQDGRIYVLRSLRAVGGEKNHGMLQCYDEGGKLLWTRERDSNDLMSIQPLGEGLVSVLDRSYGTIGPVAVLTKDGDYVTAVSCREPDDNWGHSSLRVDQDTGYVCIHQASRLTGLSTIKSAAVTLQLAAGGGWR